MRARRAAGLVLFLAGLISSSRVLPSEVRFVEIPRFRDDHTKTFESIRLEPILDWASGEPTGETEAVAYEVILKGDNLHYNAGREDQPVWEESDPALYSAPGGGWVSGKNRHRAQIPPVLEESRRVRYEVDRRILATVPSRIAYVDSYDRTMVVIGWLGHSRGELFGNGVLFRDAFTGISADVRYLNSRSGLEQDIIIKEEPADPRKFGLDPERAALVVLTELIDFPDYLGDSVQAFIGEERVDLPAQTAASSRPMAFYRVGKGKKFLHSFIRGVAYPGTSRKDDRRCRQVEVRKTVWEENGKYYLWEEIPWTFLRDNPLPVTIDYVNRSGALAASETWTAGPTYLVNGTLTLASNVTLTIEAGAVAKFADDSNDASGILVAGSNSKIIAVGDSNGPIVFTSRDDDSTGEIVPGSSGTPQSGDYLNAVTLAWNSSSASRIEYGRFAYARQAIEIETSLSNPIQHNRIADSTAGILCRPSQTINLSLRNNLLSDLGEDGIVLDPASSAITVENCTLDHCAGAGVALEGAASATLLRNNLFSSCGIGFSAETLPAGNNDYNGYFGNQTDVQGAGADAHGVFLASSPFAGSGEDPFYLDQGCALVNTGSFSSQSAGLDGFFTTRYDYPRFADQTQVDIGWHYPTFDADNDGMPDVWEEGNDLDPYADDAASDADGDGYSNLAEYRGRSDPGNSASIPIRIALSGGDFNGDGTVDIGVYRPSQSKWYISGVTNVQYGINTDIPVPGDYDGDGTADIAVFRSSLGRWYVRDQTSILYGAEGDIPLPVDYNGDGSADLAVFRPNGARWWIRNQTSIAYGLIGDLPVPGYYSGSSAAVLAVFRPSNAVWYIRNLTSFAWGAGSDFPVPGDYDGDGTWDPTLFSPQTCSPIAVRWKTRYLGGATETHYFGLYGDIPSPADYSGGGGLTLGVFRPSQYYNWLREGMGDVHYGLTGDIPLPGYWLGSDSDHDRLPDSWEEFYFGDLARKPQDDHPDYDQLVNLDEYQHGTSPLLADTDGDGLSDYAEVNAYETNPADADSDDDSFNDGLEVEYGADPLDPGDVPWFGGMLKNAGFENWNAPGSEAYYWIWDQTESQWFRSSYSYQNQFGGGLDREASTSGSLSQLGFSMAGETPYWAALRAKGSGQIRLGIKYPASTYVSYADWAVLSDAPWTLLQHQAVPTASGAEGGLKIQVRECFGEGVVIDNAYLDSSPPFPTPTLPPTISPPPPTRTPPPPPEGVVVNEILYNPYGLDTGKEWIEIFNASNSAQNLTGLFLRLNVSSTPYEFPEFSLPAHSYVLVHTNASGEDSATDLYPPNPLANMGNTQGSVSFCVGDPPSAGTFADFVQYGGGDQTWENAAVEAGIWTEDDFVLAVPEGHSMGRYPNGYDTDEPEDWTAYTVPTGGGENAFLATPTPTVHPPATPTPPPQDNEGPQLTWQITSYPGYLEINGSAEDALSNVQSVYYSIAAFHEGTGEGCSYWTSVSINPSTPDDGAFDSPEEDFHSQADETYFTCEYGRYFEAVYQIKAGDSAGNWTVETVSGPELGWSTLCLNACNGDGDPEELPPVVISEFMANPEGTEPAGEWVELYNPSVSPVALNGWTLGDTDDPEETGAYAGIFTFPASPPLSIPTGDYLVLGGSASAAGGNVDVVYNLPGNTIGKIYLANTEDRIILKDASGHLVDEVHYDSVWKIREGESVSRKTLAQTSDFVEVYNKSEGEINLEGLLVSKGSDASRLVPYATESAILSPDSYAVIFGSLFSQADYPDLPVNALVVTVDNAEISGGIGVNDYFIFYEQDGQTTIDTFTPDHVPGAERPIRGQSVERVDPEVGDVPGNWGLNEDQGSTPGGPNSVAP